MKRVLLTLFAAALTVPAMAQDASQEVSPNPEAAQNPAPKSATEGDVTLKMADGTSLRGYARTQMKNEVKFFELSDQPRSKRTRYDSDQIERITFDNGETFVKQEYSPNVKGTKIKTAWLREEHIGHGIALYSIYIERMEQVNNMRKQVRQTNYYLSIDGSPAIWASTKWYSGGVINAAGANRTMLNYLFTKRWPDYSDLAKRVKAKEFNTKGSPIEVVRAWEQIYGKE